MTARSTALSMTDGEDTPRISPVNPRFRMAKANDPPIRPTPMMATVLMCWPVASGIAPDGTRDSLYFGHHLRKLIGPQRLGSVADGSIRIRVNSHEQAVCAGSDGGPSHW